ncbi:MAG: hypothetical protein Q8L90_10305 [Bacteroidota bacterium]|nr:hypothetical protein [Bacteroidota bacterium]
MKKIILNFLMLTPLLVFGQVKLSPDFKVSTSTPFPVVDAPSKEYVGMGNGTTISVKTRGELVIIQKFDVKTMKEVQRNEYEDFPKYTKIQSLLKVGDRLYYVFEAFNKKEKTFSVYSREIDTEKGSFKEIKTLFTTKGDVVWSDQQVFKSGIFGVGMLPKFDVISSIDGSKILIQYRNRPETKDDSKSYDELGFYVFDNKFTKLWNKDLKMPHTEKEMDNIAYAINKEGTVFMLSRLSESKSFEVITISDSEGLKNKQLPIQKGLAFDKFDLRESSNGNIIAAGYYTNGTEAKANWMGIMSFSSNISGIYVFEIAKDGIIVRSNDYPFSIELIKKYLPDNQKGKADAGTAGINDLVLRNFVLNDDGSMLIIGEVNYLKQEIWVTRLEYVAHFGDIIATKIDANGKLVWSEKMPKNQSGLSGDIGIMARLGITYIEGNGAHYLLFLDNRANATRKMDLPAEPHKGLFGGYLTAYKIDGATGKIDKHLILDLKDIEGLQAYQFNVTRIFEAMDKIFMLEVYIKDKQDMMVKMALTK